MYSTQMEAAKKGIFTKEMEIVARDEKMSKEELMEKIAKGSIVIPANKNHSRQRLYRQDLVKTIKTYIQEQ